MSHVSSSVPSISAGRPSTGLRRFRGRSLAAVQMRSANAAEDRASSRVSGGISTLSIGPGDTLAVGFLSSIGTTSSSARRIGWRGTRDPCRGADGLEGKGRTTTGITPEFDCRDFLQSTCISDPPAANRHFWDGVMNDLWIEQSLEKLFDIRTELWYGHIHRKNAIHSNLCDV